MHLVSYFRSLHTFCLRVQGVVCLVDQFFFAQYVMSHWQKMYFKDF